MCSDLVHPPNNSKFYLVLMRKDFWYVYVVVLHFLIMYLLTVLVEDLVHLGPIVQKPIKANPRLKVNQGVYFSTPRYCSTLIFGKTLH